MNDHFGGNRRRQVQTHLWRQFEQKTIALGCRNGGSLKRSLDPPRVIAAKITGPGSTQPMGERGVGNSRLHRKLPLGETATLIPAQQPPYLFMSFHPPTLPAFSFLSTDGFVGRLRLIVTGVGLAGSLSRGAWLGAALALGWIALRWAPTFANRAPSWIFTRATLGRLAVIAISVYVIAYWTLRFSERPHVRRAFTVFNANDFSWRNRVATIPGSLQMIAERPFLGHGWNRAERIYSSLYKPDFMTEGAAVTQNDYLMLGMSVGAPALFCLLGWIALGLRSITTRDTMPGGCIDPVRLAASAAIIPLLIGFLFDGLLLKLTTAVPFFCLMEIVASPPVSAQTSDDTG